MGDPTSAVIDILSSAPQIQAFNCNGISSNMVGFQRGMRWIIVDIHGGSWKWPAPPHPRVDIECIAEKRTTAYQIMATCLAVMFAAQNNYRSIENNINLVCTQIETFPFESSEKDTDQVRYITSLRLIVRPYP